MSNPLDGPYNVEAIYDTEIAPLMKQIIAICLKHEIPMVASFAYADDGTGNVSLCSTVMNRKPRAQVKFEIVRKVLLAQTVLDDPPRYGGANDHA